MDPSSFFLGALLVSAKVLGIGALGFGIAWLRARKRIRHLEAERRLDQQPLLERIDQLEGTLADLSRTLERLTAGQSELRRPLPPPARPDAMDAPP